MFDETPIRVIVIDSPYMRSWGAASILMQSGELEVVAEIHHCETAQRLVAILKPDVMLLDLDSVAVESVCQVRHEADIEVLALFTQLEPQHFNRLLKAGVRGYCIKDPDSDRLCSAIKTIRFGDLWIDRNLALQVFLSATTTEEKSRIEFKPGATVDSFDPIAAKLSARELQVLQMIVVGATNREIAESLFISMSTVKAVVSRVMEKLHVGDRTQAAAFATRYGFV